MFDGGVTQSTLTALYEKQVVNKAIRILADDTHVAWRMYLSALVSKVSNCHLQIAKRMGGGCHLFLCHFCF